MEPEHLIAVLNELLAAETASLLPRLAEATVFCSSASATAFPLVEQMVVEEREHVEWLVELIRDRGGEPVPAVRDPRSGDFHFVDLGVLLPRVMDNKRRLIGTYETAAGVVADDGTEVINRIARRHHAHLDRLQQMARDVDMHLAPRSAPSETT